MTYDDEIINEHEPEPSLKEDILLKFHQVRICMKN